MYTTTFGFYSPDINFHCVRVSVKINGTDCSHPAPIRSDSTSCSDRFQIYSGVVSAICHIRTAGLLTFSTHIEAQCVTSKMFLGMQVHGRWYNYVLHYTLKNFVIRNRSSAFMLTFDEYCLQISGRMGPFSSFTQTLLAQGYKLKQKKSCLPYAL